jgi:hypothetical protein
MQAAGWNSGNQKVAPYNSWISNWAGWNSGNQKVAPYNSWISNWFG